MASSLLIKSFPKQTANVVSGLMMNFMGKDLESDLATSQIRQLKPGNDLNRVTLQVRSRIPISIQVPRVLFGSSSNSFFLQPQR